MPPNIVLARRLSAPSRAVLGAAHQHHQPSVYSARQHAWPQASSEPEALTIRPRSAVVAAAIRTRSAVSNSLISVLKDELKYSRDSYRKPEALLDNPPEGWVVEDVAGSSFLRLRRRFKNETIYVTVDLEGQQREGEVDIEEEEEEAGGPLALVVFTASVMKGSDPGAEYLEFLCQTDGEYCVIEQVRLLPGAGSIEEGADAADQSSGFTGPDFKSLDATLQQAFLDFLEERSIDDALGEWLMQATRDKQASECMAWLEKVTKFVSK